MQKKLNSKLDFIGSVGLVHFFNHFGRRFVGENDVQNGLLPLPFVFRLRSIGWASSDDIEGIRLQSLRIHYVL